MLDTLPILFLLFKNDVENFTSKRPHKVFFTSSHNNYTNSYLSQRVQLINWKGFNSTKIKCLPMSYNKDFNVKILR